MNKRILFIEDEVWSVDWCIEHFRQLGYDCDLVGDGEEAIKYLKRKKYALLSMDVSFPPGYALSDVTAPTSAGVALLNRIRSGQIKNCDPKTKVVILTAVIDQAIENSIRNLGVSAYLKKPVDLQVILKTYESVLSNKQ